MPRDPSDFVQDDKLVVRKRCGTQVGDNGGLLAGGQIGAAGHSANEMWPLISRIFGDGWQSVTFEATGDEKSAAILQLLRINVIGACICNQGGGDCRWRRKVGAANDKQDDDDRGDLGGATGTMSQNCGRGG